MNISELISKLSKIEKENGDIIVVLSSDGEGNSFSPVDSFSVGCYEEETTWCGEFSQEDENINAVVIWPIN